MIRIEGDGSGRLVRLAELAQSEAERQGWRRLAGRLGPNGCLVLVLIFERPEALEGLVHSILLLDALDELERHHPGPAQVLRAARRPGVVPLFVMASKSGEIEKASWIPALLHLDPKERPAA